MTRRRWMAGWGVVGALLAFSGAYAQPPMQDPLTVQSGIPAPEPSSAAAAISVPKSETPPAISPTTPALPTYPDAKRAALVEAGKFVAEDKSERPVRLCGEAAMAFQRMQAAAAVDAVHIILISGFRGIGHQRALFDRAIARYGSPAEAARWVAPPGQSEHHTGFAADLGDGDAKRTQLAKSFAQTKAYAWLKRRAGEFGWEESYPPGNPQGYHPEPWHWRYVGTEPGRTLVSCGYSQPERQAIAQPAGAPTETDAARRP